MIGAIDTTTGNFTLIKDAVKGNYQCICCNEFLTFKKGDIRIPHFAHLSNTNCNGESFEHKLAKYLLKYILKNNIELVINNGCCGDKYKNKIKLNSNNMRVLNKYFEYNGIWKQPEGEDSGCDIINPEIEIEYSFKYGDNTKHADVAIVADNQPYIIFEVCNTNPTLEENRPNNIPWFEIDANEIINNYNKLLDSDSIELQCIRKCTQCIERKNKKIIKEEEEKLCSGVGKIYVNQRGAGCGKTYESIQLLQLNNLFAEKDTYIYLTKMHSAKDVIYNEFKEQESDGKLSNVKLIVDNTEKKQYILNYKIVENNKLITVIIGTIDSFNYAVAADMI
jgi:hypothetical protein